MVSSWNIKCCLWTFFNQQSINLTDPLLGSKINLSLILTKSLGSLICWIYTCINIWIWGQVFKLVQIWVKNHISFDFNKKWIFNQIKVFAETAQNEVSLLYIIDKPTEARIHLNLSNYILLPFFKMVMFNCPNVNCITHLDSLGRSFITVSTHHSS